MTRPRCLQAARVLAIATLSVLVPQANAQVPNDDCSGAIQVFDGVNASLSNVGSTLSLPSWPCGQMGEDVWFFYVASCTAPISFTTCSANTTFDTTLEVFSGTCASLTSLACNDDSCGQQSTVIIPGNQGQTYHVRVGGYRAGLTGNFDLTVTCTTAVPNDECNGALPIVDGLNGPFDNMNATDSFPWPCEPTAGSDVWYTYDATCNAVVAFDTCTPNTTFDTTLEVFDGTCTSLNSLGCDDDGCVPQSIVAIQVTQGTRYYVRVGGWAQRQGTFELNVQCTQRPPNDECAQAIPVTDGANGPYANLYSTTSQPPWPCANGGADVWFSYRATCSVQTTFDTCSPGTDYDTAMEIFEGSCGALVPVTCNDDLCGQQSSISFVTNAGSTYYVRVGGYDGRQGNFVLNVAVAGSGSFSTLTPGCGAAQLVASGSPNLGGTVHYEVQGQVGVSLMWFGIPLGSPICPPAGCQLGSTFDVIFTLSQASGVIPCQPSLVGGSYATQAADIGAPGGCSAGFPAPLPLTTTQTILTTIGS